MVVQDDIKLAQVRDDIKLGRFRNDLNYEVSSKTLNWKTTKDNFSLQSEMTINYEFFYR